MYWTMQLDMHGLMCTENIVSGLSYFEQQKFHPCQLALSGAYYIMVNRGIIPL